MTVGMIVCAQLQGIDIKTKLICEDIKVWEGLGKFTLVDVEFTLIKIMRFTVKQIDLSLFWNFVIICLGLIVSFCLVLL